MKSKRSQFMLRGAASVGMLAVGCGQSADNGSSDPQGEATQQPATSATQDDLDPQVPPATKTEMARWLTAFEANGWADEWECEASETDKTQDGGDPGIHVHGSKNRVCNNVALAGASLTGDAQLPVGAAAVKYVGTDTFVEVKVDADSAAGNGWFWWAPGGVVAAKGAADCVGCHGASGRDAAHPGLGDYVYFQVAP